MKGELGNDALKSRNLNLLEQAIEQGKQYRQAFLELKRNSWTPDIIISHTAWGCGIYANEVWPKARIVSYLEWWFNPSSDFFNFDEKNKQLNISRKQIETYWLRNQSVALELVQSDVIVSPTNWQRGQLPKNLREKCNVIFDGIDNTHFKLNPKVLSKTPLITYGTRGMEPIRAFPQFIECLPEIIRSNNRIRIEIAGEDKICYGSNRPPEGTWKKWAINLLKRENVDSNVRWIGYLQGKDYIDWLSSSWCHVYLTHPFVASWSFIEAAYMGVNMVASDVETVREFVYEGSNIDLADHRKREDLIKKIQLKILSAPGQNPKRHSKLESLTLDVCTKKWLDLVDLGTKTHCLTG